MDRRTLLKLLGSVPAFAATVQPSKAVDHRKVHQPFIVTGEPNSFEAGDLVRCEAGCDYAEIVGVTNLGWPDMKPLGKNQSPFGQLFPVKCSCGAVAIREGRGWMGHIPQSNTTEIKKQDRLPVACQEATE